MKHKLIEKLNDLIQLCSNPDSEVCVEAERICDGKDFVKFTEFLMECSETLGKAKALIEEKASDLSEDDIDELGEIAQIFDESDDEDLKKKASVLDEILITIGANKDFKENFKKAESDEIEALRAKLRRETGEKLYSNSEKEYQEEAKKKIEEKVKTYRPLQGSLSTRYSPDMPGVSLMRVGENVYQCPVTKKIYNFAEGFTTANGTKIPGTSVQGQTDFSEQVSAEHQMFSTTRDDILNGSR
jgi:hypothetical protein